MISPSTTLKGYHPRISDGYIGILYRNPPRLDESIRKTLVDLGAVFVDPEEVKQP
jgi:hypothetical protein